MGCGGSKSTETKQPDGRSLPAEAARFMQLVNEEQHPVARKVLEEWAVFVEAQQKRKNGDAEGAQLLLGRSNETWATSDKEPVSHRSVDEVGKAFLAFIKHDLIVRAWGGNFSYSVAGVAKQGYLRITANVELGGSGATDECAWDIRVHYHSSGAN